MELNKKHEIGNGIIETSLIGLALCKVNIKFKINRLLFLIDLYFFFNLNKIVIFLHYYLCSSIKHFE